MNIEKFKYALFFVLLVILITITFPVPAADPWGPEIKPTEPNKQSSEAIVAPKNLQIACGNYVDLRDAFEKEGFVPSPNYGKVNNDLFVFFLFNKTQNQFAIMVNKKGDKDMCIVLAGEMVKLAN